MAARRTGMISEEDDRRLSEWLAEHPEFHKVYEEVMAWRQDQGKPEFSAEQAWDDFMRRYALGKWRGEGVSLWRRLSVACGVAVLVGVGLLFLHQGAVEEVSEAVPAVERLARACLEMEDGTMVELGAEGGILVPADAPAIDRERAEVDYSVHGGCPVHGTVEFHAITVPKYGEYNVRLSDGTTVKINSGSRLRYPVRFAVGVREVWLEGEAYFQVARDTTARFVVHTSRMDVNVLGTVFNVEAWQSAEMVRTTLLSGSVEVEWEGETACLQPGEQAAIGKEEHFTVRRVDTRAVTAWVRGMFCFDEERLEDILAYLADWYGFQVEYRCAGIRTERFSVELRRFGNVDDVLRFIEETGVVRFEREGTLIRVY